MMIIMKELFGALLNKVTKENSMLCNVSRETFCFLIDKDYIHNVFNKVAVMMDGMVGN